MNQENNNYINNNPQINSNQQSATLIQSMPQTQSMQNLSPNQNTNKKRKKLIIFIIICLIAGGLILFGSYKLLSKEDIGTTEIPVNDVDFNGYIVVKNVGKYGLINTDGKVIFEPEYSYISNVVNDIFTVSYDGNEYWSSNVEVRNINGEILMTLSGSSPQYLPNAKVWSYQGNLYDENFKQITSSGDSIYSVFVNLDLIKKINYQNHLTIIDKKNKTIFETSNGDLIKGVFGNKSTNDYYILENDSTTEETKNIYKVYSIKTKEYKEYNCNSAKTENNIFSCINDDKTINIYFKNGKEEYKLEVDNSISMSSLVTVKLLYPEKEILEIYYGYTYSKQIGKEYEYEYYDVNNKKLLVSSKYSSYNLGSIQTLEKLIQLGYEYNSEDKKIYKNGELAYDKELGNVSYLIQPLYSNKILVVLNKVEKVGNKYSSTKLVYDILSKKILYQAAGNLNSSCYGTPFLIFEEDSDKKILEDEKVTIYNLYTGKSLTTTVTKNYNIGQVHNNYLSLDYKDTRTYYNSYLKEIYQGKIKPAQ